MALDVYQRFHSASRVSSARCHPPPTHAPAHAHLMMASALLSPARSPAGLGGGASSASSGCCSSGRAAAGLGACSGTSLDSPLSMMGATCVGRCVRRRPSDNATAASHSNSHRYTGAVAVQMPHDATNSASSHPHLAPQCLPRQHPGSGQRHQGSDHVAHDANAVRAVEKNKDHVGTVQPQTRRCSFMCTCHVQECVPQAHMQHGRRAHTGQLRSPNAKS